MRRIVDQVMTLIPAAEGSVLELAHGDHLSYVCASGALADHVGTRLRLDETLSGLAIRSRGTLYCEDSATDPRVTREAGHTAGAVSMVCVPLGRGAEAIGVLKISSGKAHAFTSDDVTVLARLAGFIGAAIGAASDVSRAAAELFAGMAPREYSTVEPREPDPASGGDRSAHEGIAAFVANVLQPGIVADLAARRRIEHALASRSLSISCQPIVDLETGHLLGVEALARFSQPPARSPDAWFREAEQVGLGVQLQLLAVEMALDVLDELLDDAFVAINVGPDAIAAAELRALLESTRCDRIVMELTEHLRVDDYPHLQAALQRIRELGVRLAIDDTGAGFASLGHIVNLVPDLIKLDRQFTRGIDLDPARRALAHTLVSFAQETGADVIAEGIETLAELQTVHELGITYGQGHCISRPAPIATMPADFAHIARRRACSRTG